MILADTNIFIDFWNNSTEDLKNVFIKEDIVICGVIRAELLHGAVSVKDFAHITTMLEAFDEFNLEITDWQILGDNLYNLRKKGIFIPFSDTIIATIITKELLTGVPNDIRLPETIETLYNEMCNKIGLTDEQSSKWLDHCQKCSEVKILGIIQRLRLVFPRFHGRLAGNGD